MHPLFAVQIDLMRGFVDAAVQGTMAAASGMVAMQQAAERAMSDLRAAALPAPAVQPWWLPSIAVSGRGAVPATLAPAVLAPAVLAPTLLAMTNPLLAWQHALTQIAPVALGPTGQPGTVEVKVAVRSASGHAMALGIEMPVVPLPTR